MSRWRNRWSLLAILAVGCGGDDAGTSVLDGGGPGEAGAHDAGGSDGAVPTDGPAIDGAVPTDGPPPDVPGGVGEPAELMGITLLHNQVRAGVQTSPALPPLEWDPTLAATAAAWIAQCQGTSLLAHNPNRSVGHPYYVGENIYASTGNATAAGAVSSWASEVSNYNYANNTCSGVCGHYTQIVWRSTVKVGCAKGSCPNLSYPSTIVCNYGPGGNYNGQRPY